MKIIIDGKPYELPGDFFVERWYTMTKQYINPEHDEAKKYTDLRLAAKAALRLRLGSILKAFAAIFKVEDWRTLQPKRGEDMLVKLHQYVTILLRAEAHTLILELESEKESPDDSAGIVGSDAGTRLTLTGARFDGGQTIYQRPDAGTLRDPDATRPGAIAGAETASGGLVRDADAPEIFEWDTVQP